MQVPGKDALLEAARSEFAARGYKATSVAAIAKRAGMAVGTVYLRYPSKYELFREVYIEENREQKADLRESIDWSDPETALWEWVGGNLTAMRENPILAAWRDESIGERLRHEAGSSEMEFLSEQIDSWHHSKRMRVELTEEVLDELVVAFDVLDRAKGVGSATIEFLFKAVMNMLFPHSEAGGGA